MQNDNMDYSDVKRCKLHLVLVHIQDEFEAAAAVLVSILLQECSIIETYIHALNLQIHTCLEKNLI